MWSLSIAKVCLCRREPGKREKRQPAGDHGKGKKTAVSPTSRFANVWCCSAKKRNERCEYICFILSVMIQKSAIRMYIPLSFCHWSGESGWRTDPKRMRNDFRRQRTGRYVGGTSRASTVFRLLLFLIGIPSGSLWGGKGAVVQLL